MKKDLTQTQYELLLIKDKELADLQKLIQDRIQKQKEMIERFKSKDELDLKEPEKWSLSKDGKFFEKKEGPKKTIPKGKT